MNAIRRPLAALALAMFAASAFGATPAKPATPATPPAKTAKAAAPAKQHEMKHKVAKAPACKTGEKLVKGKCTKSAEKSG
jgi:hypothetical protein